MSAAPFNKAFEEKFPLKELNNPEHDSYAISEKSHGREEIRLHIVCDVPDELIDFTFEWKGLKKLCAFIMLIVQGCFGLLNRIAPPLNLFSLGFPINMLAGLVCFATLLYNLPDHYLHLANFVLQQLDALKGHYGG